MCWDWEDAWLFLTNCDESVRQEFYDTILEAVIGMLKFYHRDDKSQWAIIATAPKEIVDACMPYLTQKNQFRLL